MLKTVVLLNIFVKTVMQFYLLGFFDEQMSKEQYL